MCIAYGKKIILNSNDMKTLGKLFLAGVKHSLVTIGRIFAGIAVLAVILMVFAALFALGVYVIHQCGWWSVILYIIDIVILVMVMTEVVCKKFFENIGKKLVRKRRYVLTLLVETLKAIGVILLTLLILALVNGIFWGLGWLVLWPFAIKLSIGATAMIGVAMFLLVIFLFFAALHINAYGWRDALAILVRFLGEFILPAAIVVAVIYFIFHGIA